MEPIVRTARQHAGTSANGRLASYGDDDMIGLDANVVGTISATQFSTSSHSAIRQTCVQTRAVDDGGPNPATRNAHELPRRAPETRVAGTRQHELARNTEFSEGFVADESSAVNGNTDFGVFFENENVVPTHRQVGSCDRTRRTGA
jgi:hypothetical protein